MSDYDRDVDPAGILQRRLGLSRRRFLGAAATTGVAAAAALSATAPSAAAAPAAAGNTVLVPPAKRGIIVYTVRDAIGRDPLSTTLPSGFRDVLLALGDMGYRQVEFAGYSQHANAPGGANLGTVEGARILRWLPRRRRSGRPGQPRLHPGFVAAVQRGS